MNSTCKQISLPAVCGLDRVHQPGRIAGANLHRKTGGPRGLCRAATDAPGDCIAPVGQSGIGGHRVLRGEDDTIGFGRYGARIACADICQWRHYNGPIRSETGPERLREVARLRIGPGQ